MKIGDNIYLPACDFLFNKKNPTGPHYNWDVGDIVKTKYGPQLTCVITAKRLHGLSVEIISIDSTKEGHYTTWDNYKEIINSNLSPEEKVNQMLEEIG